VGPFGSPKEPAFCPRRNDAPSAALGIAAIHGRVVPRRPLLALLEQQGVHDALAQAQRSGRNIEAVRNARKRIKRRFEAIVERDEKEAGKP
jgi:hypothetical protein